MADMLCRADQEALICIEVDDFNVIGNMFIVQLDDVFIVLFITSEFDFSLNVVIVNGYVSNMNPLTFSNVTKRD